METETRWFGSHKATVGLLVAGIVLLAAGTTFGIIDLALVAPSTMCTPNLPGSILTYAHALWIAAGVAGLGMIFQAFWFDVDRQIKARYRPIRWFFHASTLVFTLPILFSLAGFVDLYFIWGVSILAGICLGYTQSSNESMNAGSTNPEYVRLASDAVNSSGMRTAFSDMTPVEGWFAGLAVWITVSLFTIVFMALKVVPQPTANIAWIAVFLGYYAAFHLFVAAWTFLWPRGLGDMGREVFYVVVEVIYFALYFVAVYVSFTVAC
jgi:hypothetical protein